MTLGSLFDGIGGFPLAGVMCGITPVWSSEIEPFPLKVTAARFPEMEQLGSVTDINGAEIEPVDIITFGSPCQDLSVAGKQLGIHEGQRSNLFFEAIRIIKEMRAADERTGRTDVDIRPRFAVWENVPGAFSSNNGADFQAVLQALASVRENGVSIPQPKKWGGAGCIVGNGWSIAWRVYDAQYWGVPQRRKRIYLVADFASERAPEILFERESLRGDTATGGEAWERIAADAEGSAGGSCIAFKERAGKPGGGKGILPAVGRAFTLATNVDQSVCYPNGEPICLNFQGNKSMCSATQDGTAYSLMAMHGHDVHVICKENDCAGGGVGLTNRGYVSGDKAETLRAESHMALPCVVQPAAFMGGQGAKAGSIAWADDGTTPTLRAAESGSNQVPDVCYAIQGNMVDRDTNQNGPGYMVDDSPTLNTVDRHAVCYPKTARALTARHDSSPCVDRGQNVVAYKQTGFAGYDEGCGTLRANGGDVGGYGEHRR